MVWVKREPGGAVCGVARRPGTDGHDEQLPDDHPDVIAWNNRDPRKPWPEQLTWTPDQHQDHEDDLELTKSVRAREALVILIKLVDKLLEKSVIVPTDFDAETRAEYQALKAVVDRWR